MKGTLKLIVALCVMATSLTSCYTYTVAVGKGAQGATQVKGKNHYVIAGLAPVGLADSKALAGGAKDYNVTITHTFVDGLLAGITFGLYTPTTVIVTK